VPRCTPHLPPFAVGLLASIFVTACAVGPTYERPAIQTPLQFKENRGWVRTAALATASQGAWWTVFGDTTLNMLEPRVAAGNQSLRASYYAYQQALALTLTRSTRAAEFPGVSADAAASRSDSGSTSIAGTTSKPGLSNSFSLGLTATWAPDLWGRVRRQVEANEAGAAATRADLLAAQLSLQATLAQDYFQIRQIDSETALAEDTVTAYEKSLELTRNRYAAGVATQADVAQAQTQLATARVQLVAFGVQRAQLEHAVAVLMGEPPSDFSLPPMPGLPPPQAVPAGLPSQLLLRRPDLAAAERQVAAANAQIGVAESAFFPALMLSAQGGWRSSTLADLLSAPNLFWSLGPTLTQTIFDGGAHRAQVAQSQAAYQQAVAQYRQISLQAFQQVEDQLSALSILADEAQLQQRSVAAAAESLRLATNQYKAGTAPYLNVLTAQTVAYSARNGALQIAAQRLTAGVALIQALGGGWGNNDRPALGGSVQPADAH